MNRSATAYKVQTDLFMYYSKFEIKQFLKNLKKQLQKM